MLSAWEKSKPDLEEAGLLFRAIEIARGMILKSIKRDQGMEGQAEAMSWWL
jgi:hypothetical protein